jgi:hypothetical protein
MFIDTCVVQTYNNNNNNIFIGIVAIAYIGEHSLKQVGELICIDNL